MLVHFACFLQRCISKFTVSLFILLLSNCQCNLIWNFENNVDNIEDNNNWKELKKVLQKMEHTIINSSTRIEDYSVGSVEFINVVITNWLEEIKQDHVTYFEQEDTYVIVANYTIPYLLFSGYYLYETELTNDRNKVFANKGIVNCAMDDVLVGMFVNFYKPTGIIYVDNFMMMTPTEYVHTRTLLLTHDDTSENESDIYKHARGTTPHWKDIIVETAQLILCNYLDNFITSIDALNN